jgi:plastocyanin domain-containing protein
MRRDSQNHMNKTVSIIIICTLILGIGIIFFGGSSRNGSGTTTGEQNSETRDGVQYITIHANAGYSPRVSTAKAGIPTKLIVKTTGTYDCSASLVIKSLNYKKILPQTGEEIIDIGTPVVGTPLLGVCGMGMYNFLVNFN